MIQVNRLEQKEDLRKKTETELVRLRQEILLLGELQLKYKEQLRSIPLTRSQKQEQLHTEAYEKQIEGTLFY